MAGALLTTLRVLTFLTALAVGLSPFPEIYRVYKQRDAEEVSILPIVTLFANSYLWMIYGYLVGEFFPLFSVTAFAAVTSILFSAVYIWFCKEKRTSRRFYSLWGGALVLLVVVTIYVSIAIAGVTHQSKHQVVNILGYCCVVMNLCLKIAPLETIKRIVRTKNASSMPVTMSIVAFVNGALWVWTCLIIDDMFVLTPNAAGTALGGIQVVLYIIYRPGKAVADAQGTRVEQSGSNVSSCFEPESGADTEQTKATAFAELRSPRS